MKKIFIILTFVLISFTAYADLVDIFGNSEVGDKCASDYQCDTLCCNAMSGTCAPHNPKGEPAVFCNKESGMSCVAGEFCKSQIQTVCRLFKVPPQDGVDSCIVRCTYEVVPSSCINRLCVPGRIPPMPKEPYDCSTALDP